jgi:predicted transposase YbfD/YdcC
VSGEGDEEIKQTNEIKMVIPLLENIDIQGKEITADALLTQRKLASYLVEERQAHYHFTVKGNQSQLRNDIALYFQNRQEPDFVDHAALEHGRIETRKIWTTSEVNGYLNFPHVGQAFVIERESIEKKTGKLSKETAYGITSRLMRSVFSRRTAATGASKTAAIILLTGTMMRIADGYELAMALKTSLV